MPRVKEEPVLAAPGRDIAVTAAVLALTAAVFALAADHGILARVQRVDDAWLRLMISARSAPVTAAAKFFNLLGLVYVTLPVRIAIGGFLALRRRWWHLAAFAAAVVLTVIGCGSGGGAPVGRRWRPARCAGGPGGVAGTSTRSVSSLTAHPAIPGSAGLAQAPGSGTGPACRGTSHHAPASPRRLAPRAAGA